MPTDRQLIEALRTVRHALDGEQCWHLDGRFYFRVDGPWLLSVSSESAGRFRVDACYGLTPVATMWALAWDRDRLAGLASAARAEVAALA